MERTELLQRTRTRGVTPLVYWLVRALLQPFFHVYFRLSRIGREHIPAEGPVIFASNHRSFLDPFVIATLARRPIYFMAKRELFRGRVVSWLLSSLGAFPIDRGNGDNDAMATAREILERGDGVLIFPEGTRTRPGSLGRPRRGVGRLALETGAPVVPVAVIGTEDVRRGWRVRPHKVRIRVGRPLTFPTVASPSPALAGAVTDRIWPCVELQWEWLGGAPRLRRAAVVGAGAWGTSLAVALQRAGLEVDLGCRTAEQAVRLRATRVNEAYLPGVALPESVHVMRAAELELAHHDLVCLAVPTRELPAAVAALGERIPARAGVLVLGKGLVAPGHASLGVRRASARPPAPWRASAGPDTPPTRWCTAPRSWPPRPTRRSSPSSPTSSAPPDTTWSARPTSPASSWPARPRTPLSLAASAAAVAGPNAAGAAAGKVFAEVHAYARAHGGQSETFAGLAGAGDLVATVVAQGSRNRRAGEMLGRGVPVGEIGSALGQAAEGLDALPLLAAALRESGVDAPAVSGLAAVVEGRADPGAWAEDLTRPRAGGRARRRAA